MKLLEILNMVNQRALGNMVYTFFDKKIGLGAKSYVNEVLGKELHKPVKIFFFKKKMSLYEI